MTAIAAGALISGGLGIYKTIQGANQKADAKKLAASNVFTPMQMPGQVKQATNLAAQNYYNGMPGTAAAQNLISNNGANAFYNGSQGASSGGDLLDLAAKINQGQNVATNNLSLQAANYKANALGGYENALNNEGDWQAKLYNNNVLQPYLRTANTAASMYGAGAQNEFSGLDQIGTAALGYANGYQPKQYANMGEKLGNPTLDAAASTMSGYTPTNIAGQIAAASLKKRGY